jgi:hypothetical protein
VLVKSLLEKRLDVQANNFRMLASFTKSLSDEISSIKVQARKLSQKPNAN